LQFTLRALEYFRQVEQSGEALIITDHGRPVLKVIPYSAELSDVLNALRNSVRKYDRPMDPVGLEDWESLT
jgi:antitoxin (DNA-binding transcriptional repressor) of toxin-antitoxin stability system